MIGHSILSFVLAIPRPVLLLIVAAIYGVCVRWRFSWPMLIDGLLLIRLVWQPSIGWAAWVMLLMVVRHVPPFAQDAARLLRLHEFEGWTLRAGMFVLPALRVYTNQPERAAIGVATAPPPIVAASTPQPPAPSLQPLRPAAWLGAVNDDQTAPHLGVVGPTRLGKTTFVLACLGRRAGLIVITTPKAADVDPWGGATVARLHIDLDARAVDWTPIEGAIDSVHYEMLRRNATNAAKDAPRLSLIVDELSTTLANCARKTKSQIIELWNMGAGANINLIVCDPEVNSAAWGVQGRRDILGNLVFAQVSPGRRWNLGRIDPNGRLIDPQALDTAPLLQLAREAHLAGRTWAGAAGVPRGVPPLPPPHDAPPPAVGSGGTGTGTEEGTPIDVLRILRSNGKTREWARANGCKFRDLDWTEAGKP